MKPWSPRAMHVLNDHVFTVSGRDARRLERRQITAIVEQIAQRSGSGWISAWMVRAAIDGQTTNEGYDPLAYTTRKEAKGGYYDDE